MRKIIYTCKIFFAELLQLLVWLLRYRKSSKTEPGSNKGTKVVVFGNGPSAKDFPYQKYMDLGYDMCCVNFLATDEERFLTLKPKFYCCVDPVFADPVFQRTEKCQKLIRSLESVDWDMKFICYRNAHLPINNPHITFAYISPNVLPGEMYGWRKKIYDRNMASCGFQNVGIAAVYYFIMTRAEHVLLTGVENNWHRELYVDEKNVVYRIDTHYYGQEKINLIEAGEIKQGQLYLYFEWYTTTLKQYANMAEYAKLSGVPVENTCLDGYIDVFPKVKA